MEKYSGGRGSSPFRETQMYKDIMAYFSLPRPYFSKFNFSKYGNINDPVNFFGKSDKSVFHKKFKEMDYLLKNTDGNGVFRV